MGGHVAAVVGVIRHVALETVSVVGVQRTQRHVCTGERLADCQVHL